MKYSYKNIHIIKELLEKETFISKCYDLLNHYTLDTIVEHYDYSETEMAKNIMKQLIKNSY